MLVFRVKSIHNVEIFVTAWSYLAHKILLTLLSIFEHWIIYLSRHELTSESCPFATRSFISMSNIFIFLVFWNLKFGSIFVSKKAVLKYVIFLNLKKKIGFFLITFVFKLAILLFKLLPLFIPVTIRGSVLIFVFLHFANLNLWLPWNLGHFM